MSDLPGRPVSPLPPPEGAFDAVTRRARHRRARTALLASGAALGVAVGGVGLASLGGGTSPAAEDRLLVETPSPTPTPLGTPSPLPVETPTASPSPTPPVSPSPTASPTPSAPPSPTTFTGRVVDSAGKPLAGIVVTRYSGTGQMAEVPEEHDGTTAADGTFTVPCGIKVLLSTFEIGYGRQPETTRNYAARWWGPSTTLETAARVPCRGASEPVPPTTMVEGGVIEGAFRSVDGQPARDGIDPGGGVFCLPLGLGETGQCTNWVVADGRYRFVGLPTGTYTLQTTLNWDRDVKVVAGRTTTKDWWDCEQCRNGDPAPSPTPT